jgi:thiamine biosynthesis protein ThiS
MTLTVSGQRRLAPETTTLADLLVEEGEPVKHVVVEVNGRYVPREAYAGYLLVEGDRIEIILPAFGG